MGSEKLSLHNLKNVNTVLSMLYDEKGNYRPGFKPDEFYNAILLDTLKYGEENYVHLKWCETVNIRKGEKTAKFRRWAGMTPTLRPLQEGIPPMADKHAYETMEVGNVFSFGRWSEYTDQINLSIISDIVSERSIQYGENANQTKELYARKTWLSAPNEYFANFRESFKDIKFGDAITIDDLRFLVARMKRMMVKPVGGKFNYICSQEFINGLIDDPRVQKYMEINQTTGNLWTSGEVFPLFELQFIPTMLDEFAYPDVEFPGVYEDASGNEIIRLYAVVPSSKTIYYLDVRNDFTVKGSDSTAVSARTSSNFTYLKDGTAVDVLYKWEVPTDTVTFTSSNAQTSAAGDATSSKVSISVQKYNITKDKYGITVKTFKDVQIGSNPVYSVASDVTAETFATGTYYTYASSTYTAATVYDASTTYYTKVVDSFNDVLDTVNTLVDNGAFMQLPVHRGILFGDEALIKLNIEGLSDAPKVIIKALGSSGVGDPLDQRQSVGYKVDGFGLAIKRPEAICITYGIPANAEFAAFTAKYINDRDYTTLDLANDSSDTNKFVADAYYDANVHAMQVDGINVQKGTEVKANNYPVNGNNVPEYATGVAYTKGQMIRNNGQAYVVAKDIATTDNTEFSNIKSKLIKIDGMYLNLVAVENDPTSNVK